MGRTIVDTVEVRSQSVLLHRCEFIECESEGPGDEETFPESHFLIVPRCHISSVSLSLVEFKPETYKIE